MSRNEILRGTWYVEGNNLRAKGKGFDVHICTLDEMNREYVQSALENIPQVIELLAGLAHGSTLGVNPNEYEKWVRSEAEELHGRMMGGTLGKYRVAAGCAKEEGSDE